MRTELCLIVVRCGYGLSIVKCPALIAGGVTEVKQLFFVGFEELTAEVDALPRDALGVLDEVAKALQGKATTGREVDPGAQAFDTHFFEGKATREDPRVIGSIPEVQHAVDTPEFVAPLEGVADVVHLVAEGGGDLLYEGATLDDAVNAGGIRCAPDGKLSELGTEACEVFEGHPSPDVSDGDALERIAVFEGIRRVGDQGEIPQGAGRERRA